MGLDHEIRRLDAQVDLFWREERHILRRAGLSDGMAVLDCGCGPGRLLELLSSEFNGLSLTGIDIDPTLVTVAKDRLAAVGLDDITIAQASVEQPGLPDEAFDFITMRLVLEHVVDPVAALRSVKRLLKPGGRIAIVSNDFAFHTRTWPDVPELDDLYGAYIANRRADGGSPTIGRRVPQILREAGFSVSGFEVEAAHNYLEGDPAFQLAEGAGIAAQLVNAGYLDEQVFERLVVAWRTMLADPDHTIMRPLFVAVGVNGGDDAQEPATSRATRVSATDADFVAPTTDTERAIAGLWSDAIGVEHVGVDQNFFDLGGTSLQLEEIQVGLEEIIGRQLPMTMLFQYPTVGSLARHLEASEEAAARSAANPSEPVTTASESRVGDDVSAQAKRRREAMMRRKPIDE